MRRQTFDGYSPLQWWFGTQCAREVEGQGLGENRSSFERRLQFHTAAQAAFIRADARKTLRMAQYARSRVLRNPTVGQLEIPSEGAKVGSVAVVIVVLVERSFFLVLQEYLQLNSLQRRNHKSQQLCGWPMDCSSLDTSLFEAANPVLRYLVLHGFETEICEELSTLILGILRLNRNVWMLGKIPMVENSNNTATFSHHHQIQMLCQHFQLQNHSLHRILIEILAVLHLVSMLFDFVTALDVFSHDQIHLKAHTMSQISHLACEMNQGWTANPC